MTTTARMRSIILFAVIATSALWRWWPVLETRAVLPDETVYITAARHLAADASPYDESGYFYPPTLAALIRMLSIRLTEIDALRLLRASALAGVVLSVWLSLGVVRWSFCSKGFVGALFVAFAPAVDVATSLGNVAGLAVGLSLVGLLGWRSRPMTSGAILGAGIALKPVAPLAPILLLAHRPRTAAKGHLAAASMCAALVTAALVPYVGYLPGLLANARGHTNPYNFSLHKLLADLGLAVPPLVVATVVGAVSILALRRAKVCGDSLLTIVITASLLALPILWAHSLLLLLPVQLLALDACSRALRRGFRESPRATLPVVFALLSVAATCLANAVGAAEHLPHVAAVTAHAVPLLAIPFLGWFVLEDLDTRETKSVGSSLAADC